MIRSLMLVLFIGVILFATVSGQRGIPDNQVLYKPSLFTIFNKQAHMGVILDHSSRLIVVLNHDRSAIIVVDLSERVRYYLGDETQTLNNIWSNYRAYFDKLSSLKSLLEAGKERGNKSKVSTLQEPVRGVLEGVFKSLEGNSPMPVELALLTNFIEQLSGSLSLVYKGSGSFKIAIGVDTFLEVDLVMAELLSCSQGKLSSENAYLNATQIFDKVSSGAQVLLKVLSIVGKRFDLAELFKGLVTSPEKVQSLLINTTRRSNSGLDGMVKILAEYEGIFTERNDINQLIKSVLTYKTLPSLPLGGFVKQLSSLLAEQNERFHNGAGLRIYASILKDMMVEDYTVYNMSLPDIITSIAYSETKRSSNPLFTLMQLLSSLYPASTIPHFFGPIIKQLNETLLSGSTPEDSNSRVFFKQYFIAIIHEFDKMGLMFDSSSRLIVALNGKRSSIFVVDIREKAKYFLKNEADTQKSIWSNFREYFREVTSLKSFSEAGRERGEKYEMDVLDDAWSDDLEEVITSLGGSLPLPEELSLHIQLIEDLRVPLPVVYRGMGSFIIASGVDAFTKVNLAEAKLLSCRDESCQ